MQQIAIHIQDPHDEQSVDWFINNQMIVTIEDYYVDGGILVMHPMLEFSLEEAVDLAKKLQYAYDTVINWENISLR